MCSECNALVHKFIEHNVIRFKKLETGFKLMYNTIHAHVLTAALVHYPCILAVHIYWYYLAMKDTTLL